MKRVFFVSYDSCLISGEFALRLVQMFAPMCQDPALIKPVTLYSTTLGRPPFFAMTPTFSSGEAFQTSTGI